jgi:hypothetical protein
MEFRKSVMYPVAKDQMTPEQVEADRRAGWYSAAGMTPEGVRGEPGAERERLTEMIGSAGGALNFGGPLARTANKKTLVASIEAEAKGATPKQIWDATGWFRGVDGRWRFELPGREHVQIKDVIPNRESQGYQAQWKLPAFYQDPELYAAYPELAGAGKSAAPRVVLERSFSGPSGGTSSQMGAEIVARAGNKEELGEILRHEIQHQIQAKEGFTPGGSALDLARQEPLLYRTPRRSFDLYERLAGEVEARNAALRGDPLTPPQNRLVVPPWITEDVPRQQQLLAEVVRRRLYNRARARSLGVSSKDTLP